MFRSILYCKSMFTSTYQNSKFSLYDKVWLLLIVPGIPGDFFVNEINSTAVIVTWNEPDIANGIITMYEILYSLGNHSILDNNTSTVWVNETTNTSYAIVISGLEHFTVYTVAVKAYTRIGGGNLTDTFSILTDPFSKLKPFKLDILVQ